MKILTQIKNRQDFREWLSINHNKAKECWILIKRGKPIDSKIFYYIDAVEEALCFGWIDSIHKASNVAKKVGFLKKIGKVYMYINIHI